MPSTFVNLNVPNCEIGFVCMQTGKVEYQAFNDPIIAIDQYGRCIFWNGDRWCLGVSTGGVPILTALTKVTI